MNHFDVLIIGAGITGLTLGHKCLELKKNCLLLEKSKGVGGRIATRRIEDFGFDHGSPVDPRNPDKVVNRGINQIAKSLAKGLEIKKSAKITRLEKDEANWIAITEGGEKYSGKKIILTAPLPQSLELLRASDISFDQEQDLLDVTYSKAIMYLVVTEEENLTPSKTTSPTIHSLLSMKQRSLHPRGWVLRLNEITSEEKFDKDRPALMKELKNEFLSCFSQYSPTLTSEDLMKWRYAVPQKILPKAYIELQKDLFLTGDAFDTKAYKWWSFLSD